MAELDDMPLAAYRRRQPGEIRRVVLQGGEPPLVVAFETPDGMKLAEAEAAAHLAMAHLAQNPEILGRYGLEAKKLTPEEIFAISKIITACETARVLWRDWNYALVTDEGAEPVKAELTPANIAQLLVSDEGVRAAWNVHLDAASPLERAEGNGSGASPNTSSAEAPSPEAPPSAGTAPSATSPAPADSPTDPDGSAPA